MMVHNVELIHQMIFEDFMTLAFACLMSFSLHNLFVMMSVFCLGPVQASKLLNKLIFSKANKLIGLFNKGVAAAYHLPATYGLEFLLIVAVELIDFFHVLVDDHLLVVL